MDGLSTDDLIKAYSLGIFPMAESSDSPEIYFVDPEMRGILPLDGFHIPKRLKRVLRNSPYPVTVNHDFAAVIDQCRKPTKTRPDSWINPFIRNLYVDLHRQGFAHSIEVWDDGDIIGGLYGAALGSVFFGESMFSRKTNGSKIALVHLVARLKHSGFTLLDTQFTTPHLEQFGGLELPRDDFKILLASAIAKTPDIALFTATFDEGEIINRMLKGIEGGA